MILQIEKNYRTTDLIYNNKNVTVHFSSYRSRAKDNLVYRILDLNRRVQFLSVHKCDLRTIEISLLDQMQSVKFSQNKTYKIISVMSFQLKGYISFIVCYIHFGRPRWKYRWETILPKERYFRFVSPLDIFNECPIN